MQKVRELKFHRPLLSDAELQFLMGPIAEKHHRLQVVAEMLEEDLKELDRRTDITQLSNIEIIETEPKSTGSESKCIHLKN